MKLQIKRVEWSGAARVALMRAARHDTTGGLQSLDDVLSGGVLFEAVAVPVGGVALRYVLKVVQRTHAREGIILAAAGGLRGADLTRDMLPAIENQFRAEQCAAVMIQTRRAGLRAKLEAQGYRADAWIMRKRLEVLQ